MKTTVPIFKRLAMDFLIIFPFVLFLFLRLDGIFKDMSNSDAMRWHRRSEAFTKALKDLDFGQTYQRYHPGVTLMWITSSVEFGIKGYSKWQKVEFKTLENTDGYLLIDGISKMVLVAILFILLVIQYRYIVVLYDRGVALLFVYLAAIEPYFIGINRWYHLTSLEVFFSFCSFLTFVLWSEYREKSYIIKSGIFFGLAVLTKFSSLFLIPTLAFVLVFSMLKNQLTQKSYYLKSAGVFGLTALLTVVALFPALWVAPLEVVKNIAGAAVGAGSGEYQSVLYAEKYPYLYYLLVILFKLSPLTLSIFLAGLIKSYKWKDNIALYTLMYVASFVFLLSLSEQKIERYIISIFPAIFLIGALVLSRSSKVFIKVGITATLVFVLSTYFADRPTYSAYYSRLFGGPNAAYRLGLYDDNGEFFATAARYLNTKGRDVRVYVPYNLESFSPYFKGVLNPTDVDLKTSYLVVSKDSRRSEFKIPELCEKEVSFFNHEFEVLTIYKCSSPLSLKR